MRLMESTGLGLPGSFPLNWTLGLLFSPASCLCDVSGVGQVRAPSHS